MSSSSDQFMPSVNSSSKYPPCRQGSALWLFYKGERLKPDPLRPSWNTFTAPPRTRVPVKAPRPSMRFMLTLTIPKWLEDIKDTEEHVLPLIPDSRSHSLVRQASAVCQHYQKSSVCPFGWRYCGATDTFPYEIHVARAVYTAHGVCFTTGASGMRMQRSPVLSWAAMYDSFFQSIWEDVLRENGFQLEFRPVWPVLYLQNTFPTTYTTAPDVVISYRGVPLFIVEYVKVHRSLSYEGIDPHLEHMKVSMQSALVGRKELRPIFGLLICEGAVMTEYGYVRDNKFCSKTTGNLLSPLFDMTKPFDVLALRMMILNVHSYAQKISEAETMDTKVRHIPYGSPGYNRAYLGSFPVLINDASRSGREVDAQWMVSRRMRLNGPVSQSDDLYQGLSDTLKSWLSLFVCCDIPAVLDNDLMSNCARFLTSRQKPALDQLNREIPQVYDALHTDRLVTSSSNPDRAALIQDAQRATSFFAGIQDTFGTKDEKPCPIRLSILLNSFLTAAWTDIRAKGPSSIQFQCYPSWSMHRKVHTEDVDPMPHHEIVPDAAFVVGPDCVFGGAAFSGYTYEAQFEYSNELSVAVNPSIYTGTTIPSEVPLLIVEYVKDYGAGGRKSHLVHLSMAMKSAMGLFRALALPPIVLGLLVDGFRVTVVCCSGSEVEVCPSPPMGRHVTKFFVICQDLVTELPEKYDFDLFKPIDVFRLRRCMRNVWKLGHEVKRLDRGAHVEVEKSIYSGTFPWWKASSDRQLGSNQTNDTIRDWYDGVASRKRDWVLPTIEGKKVSTGPS
ncbi:hypothetical protein EV421DRAFT_1105219 [Armillaria borealis]|uniref:Uncharacterized protein n=1 Tax=Armillaria borealis TaxID=47425 RepID=A0AA39J7N9_9AGAR|nr:hypothetical protein EV421DRAFT_1105219 [Armillaria borealis]